MASCTMPKRKDLIEPWMDWITEPLPQEEKLQKINKWKWRGRDSIWSIKMEQTRNRARITYKQECETNPSHPDRELRRPAPRAWRSAAPSAAASFPAEVSPHCTGRRLRSAAATSCSSWLTTGWWPKLLHARETSSSRRPPPSSRHAEARVKPGDAAAALESCCTFSS